MFQKGIGRLDTALKEVIGASGTVRHSIPRIEVEIADIELSIGKMKAYVLLEEARALKLPKATHIKIKFCQR